MKLCKIEHLECGGRVNGAPPICDLCGRVFDVDALTSETRVIEVEAVGFAPPVVPKRRDH